MVQERALLHTPGRSILVLLFQAGHSRRRRTRRNVAFVSNTVPLLNQLEAVNGRVRLIEGLGGLCRVQWKREGISIRVN